MSIYNIYVLIINSPWHASSPENIFVWPKTGMGGPTNCRVVNKKPV
jgi:hypothetical protein